MLPGIRADFRVFPKDADFPGRNWDASGEGMPGDGLDLSDSVNQGAVESAWIPQEGAQDLLQGVGIEKILKGSLEVGEHAPAKAGARRRTKNLGGAREA